MVTLPVIFTACTAFHFSAPPLACRFLATISSTDCASATAAGTQSEITSAARDMERSMMASRQAQGGFGVEAQFYCGMVEAKVEGMTGGIATVECRPSVK